MSTPPDRSRSNGPGGKSSGPDDNTPDRHRWNRSAPHNRPKTIDLDPVATRDLLRMALEAIVLLLVQAGIGMIVNLFVTIPAHHPGSRPSNYFGGSFRSVTWAITQGPLPWPSIRRSVWLSPLW
jgi:hypothetical protein